MEQERAQSIYMQIIAQAKIRIMLLYIHYLIWRVMTGRHTSVELPFMLVGHTKFSPDHYFGLIKKVYRRSTVSTIFDISRQV